MAKSNFGHVHRITCEVGVKLHTWRSKLEYRYAVYLELLRKQGLIQDWLYEPEDMAIEFEHGRYGNTRKYLPDFGVLNLDGEWEIHETKGWFPPIDYTKLKRYSEMHSNPITLIFASLPSTSRNSKTRAQRRRAERLEPHIKRVIYDANKSIFAKIRHLFEF